MGKVQRGRRKNYTKSRRTPPKLDNEPEEPSDHKHEPVKGGIEGGREVDIVKVSNGGNREFFAESPEEAQGSISGQPVFFSDLPNRFSVMNFPLFSRKYLPFVQCDICSTHTVKAIVSECGHRFCDNCSRKSQAGLGVFCQYCRKLFQFNILGVSEDFLARLIFMCRCGFEGNAEEILLHTESKGGRCHDHRLSLLPLLRPNHNLTRNRNWAERSEYLLPSSYYKRKAIRPPRSCDLFLDTFERNSALPHVYLDFDADGLFLGRLYVELHEDIVPKTVEKFLDLVKDPKGYKGGEIDFMVPDMFFQVKPSSGYGRTVRAPYADENFKLKHDKPGAVAMSNFGPNTNQTGFYITNAEMPWRDGCNVVFGYVLSGQKIITRICELARDDGSTARRVKILDCGIIVEWILPSIFSGFELFDST